MGLYGSPQVGNSKDNPNDLNNKNLIKCPKCGSFYSGSYCPICNRRINAHRQPARTPPMVRECPVCHTHYSGSHCPKCGYSIYNTCKSCGNKFIGDFCNNCGAPRNEAVFVKYYEDTSTYQQNRIKPVRTNHTALIVVIIICIFMLVAIFSGAFGDWDNTTVNNTTNSNNIASTTTMLTREQKEDYIAHCFVYTYDNLIRNPKSYIDKKAVFTGNVIQIQEGLLSSNGMRVDTGNDKVIYVNYTKPSKNDSRIIEGDNIVIYGELNDLMTYTAVLGNQITIPQITAKFIEREVIVEKIYTFDDTFIFDNIEITLGSNISWYTIDNEYNDYNGSSVFSIPVTITNKNDESYNFNSYYYTKYSPDGLELDDVSYYFDNNIDSAGDMRSGATQTADMYFLYKGDGDYYLEFNKYSTKKVEVRLSITK